VLERTVCTYSYFLVQGAVTNPYLQGIVSSTVWLSLYDLYDPGNTFDSPSV